ncbi:hypothetical protein ACFQL7_16085 [Halocatena marina]|uniref:Uncharacterized protein n=1 Tax=Halocatena marina TaxID=2934937 RepID=A0ABD5YPA2_9EURY
MVDYSEGEPHTPSQSYFTAHVHSYIRNRGFGADQYPYKETYLTGRSIKEAAVVLVFPPQRNRYFPFERDHTAQEKRSSISLS